MINGNWKFVRELLTHMGFNEQMSSMKYTLAQRSSSHIILNGGIIQSVPFWKLVREGCLLSPLLYVIVTYPILTILHNMAREGDRRIFITIKKCLHRAFQYQMITSCFWIPCMKTLLKPLKCEIYLWQLQV